MKKVYLGAMGVIAILFVVWGSYPTHPLRGEVDSVSITRRSLVNKEYTIEISSKADLARIQDSLSTVWIPIYPSGSYEGMPRFKMQVKYKDGTAETFSFTRTEFISGAYPPEKFIRTVESIFSEKVAK